MDISSYDAERDFDAVVRIWREVGWIDSDSEAKAMEYFLDGTDCFVSLIDGSAECAVMTTPGLIRYQDVDLPLSLVSGVTTSLVGRKLGLASGLTAHAVGEAGRGGAAVSILGMFEQGFYDQFGFGSGSYEHHIRFDPASLQVDVPYRPPVRLTVDDWEAVAAAFKARPRRHGGTTADPPGFIRAEMMWADKPFGLGYRSETGELTHFIWGRTKGESGPYRVQMLSYQTTDQLLELFLGELLILGRGILRHDWRQMQCHQQHRQACQDQIPCGTQACIRHRNATHSGLLRTTHVPYRGPRGRSSGDAKQLSRAGTRTMRDNQSVAQGVAA